MKFNLQSSLNSWRNNTADRVKLQHVYLVIAVGSILVAGLVGLISYDTGQRLVTVGLVSLSLYLINTVVWALIDGLLLVRIDRRSADPTEGSPATAKKPVKNSPKKQKAAPKK